MKKISFSDKYGLTALVLNGIKTMTRRAIPMKLLLDAMVYSGGDTKQRDKFLLQHAPYKVGDVVAVSQSYKTIYDELEERKGNAVANAWWCDLHDRIGEVETKPGYRNKMYVRADMMPHQIKFTKSKVELLRDVSEHDCCAEGIVPCVFPIYEGSRLVEEKPGYTLYHWKEDIEDTWSIGGDPLQFMADKPDTALCVLLYKLTHDKTFIEKNPLMYAYEYKLIA